MSAPILAEAATLPAQVQAVVDSAIGQATATSPEAAVTTKGSVAVPKVIPTLTIPTLPKPSVVPSDIDLRILGLGVAYPSEVIKPEEFEEQALRLFKPSPAIQKTLVVNRKTGIEQRPVLYGKGHPFHNSSEPAPINEISDAFRAKAVPLAAEAATRALADATLTARDLTHVVCTTVTDSSNPGYDVNLVDALGIADNGVERYLLAGVGCAGGLAALRTASNLVIAARATGRPARVLVVAMEIVSGFAVMELARAEKLGKLNVGVSLFSDCATAIVISSETAAPAPVLASPVSSNDDTVAVEDAPAPIPTPEQQGIYSVHGYTNYTLPKSGPLLRYDVNPYGWNVVLSPQLPLMTSASVEPLLKSLLGACGLSHLSPTDVDWAVHPGGAAILRACGDKLGLGEEDHLRASWGVYTKRGNSSSATVFSVLEALRGGKHTENVLGIPGADAGKGREWVIAVAFGPGVTVEMTVLRRVGYSAQ